MKIYADFKLSGYTRSNRAAYTTERLLARYSKHPSPLYWEAQVLTHLTPRQLTRQDIIAAYLAVNHTVANRHFNICSAPKHQFLPQHSTDDKTAHQKCTKRDETTETYRQSSTAYRTFLYKPINTHTGRSKDSPHGIYPKKERKVIQHKTQKGNYTTKRDTISGGKRTKEQTHGRPFISNAEERFQS